MGEAEAANCPHVAICPSAGIGHLLPYLRLASMVSSANFKVTLITINPTLSAAESTIVSNFLSAHPHINNLDITLPDLPPPDLTNKENFSKTNSDSTGPDPFFLRYDAISRSAHLFNKHIFSLSPVPTAIIFDVMFVSGFTQALVGSKILTYVVCVVTARFFALTAYLPHLAEINKDKLETITVDEDGDVLDFPPTLCPVPKSSIPPPFFNLNHIFTKVIASNSGNMDKTNGVIINTFDFMEPETIQILRQRRILSHLPPIYPIGPFFPLTDEKQKSYPLWLDEQPDKSVLFVCFGSRTAMPRDQIHEVRDALEKTGVRFLWVIKTTTVDKDEKNVSLEEILGEGFLKRTKDKGLALKEWVNQESILDHPSIRGFVSHCGWNSAIEAAVRGIPVLAWPQHGDQKVNAVVLANTGMAILEKGWEWTGGKVVKCDELVEKIKEVMESEELRKRAAKVGEEATKAWGNDGSSRRLFDTIINEIKSRHMEI